MHPSISTYCVAMSIAKNTALLGSMVFALRIGLFFCRHFGCMKKDNSLIKSHGTGSCGMITVIHGSYPLHSHDP